jgi:thiol:disulfide interchange protein DsbC
MKSRGAKLFASSVGALVLTASSIGHSDEQPSGTISKEELVSRYPNLRADDIEDGPIAGLYQVSVAGKVSYVTTDGRYLIRGEIVDLSTHNNLTEDARVKARSEMFRTIDPATEIVFSPAPGEVKHRVFVFTDVDCGYCRQFHREIAAVNALGIEVRYLSFPRTGPNTESWSKAEGVWCAADRKAALTQAKLGGEVAAVPDCTSAPIATHYELGQRAGLSGTPGVYSESGADLGGYSPPQQLLERLEALSTSH